MFLKISKNLSSLYPRIWAHCFYLRTFESIVSVASSNLNELYLWNNSFCLCPNLENCLQKAFAGCSKYCPQGLLNHTMSRHNHLGSSKMYHILHLLQYLVNLSSHCCTKGKFQHLHHPLLERLGILHASLQRQGPLVPLILGVLQVNNQPLVLLVHAVDLLGLR